MKFSRSSILVGMLTLLALAFRLWKIDHGLPEVYYMDEGRVAYLALNMGGGDLNPHHFLHPNLYYYLMFFGDIAFILLGLLSGFFQKASDAWALYKTDPTVYYLIARGISAFLGALTVPVTYLIGNNLWRDKRVGAMGAGFLALCFLHVQWSQIGYMDAPLTFFVMLAFLMATRATTSGKTRFFLLAGLIGGLAASTKYQGFITFLWGPLAAAMLAWQKDKRLWSRYVLNQTCLFTLLFVLGFTLGTPYWILDFPVFKEHFFTVWSWFKLEGQGQLGYDGHLNWFYYLLGPLRYGLGLPLEIGALVGMLYLLTRWERRNFFFVSFPIVYFAIAGFSDIHKSSYVLPLVPFLALSAAYWTVWLLSKWTHNGEKLRWVLSLTSALLVLPSLLSILRYSYLRTFPDTRSEAMEWVRTQLAPKEKVLTSFFSLIGDRGNARIKRLDPTLFDVRLVNRSSLKTLEEYRRLGFDYLVMDDWHKDTILVEGARHPQYHQRVKLYKQFMRELETSGILLVVLSPYKESSAGFDLENVQILSRDLWKLKRPGPEIRIYKI